MNKFRPFLALLLVCLLLSVPVSADDDFDSSLDDVPSFSEDIAPASNPAPPEPEDTVPAPDPAPPEPEDTVPAPDPAPPEPEDTAPAPDPAPPEPEDTAPAPDLAPPEPEDTAPASDPVPPESVEGASTLDNPFDDYSPVYGGSGGAVESFQTTTDAGTSVVLVDVQSHDMISVPSVCDSGVSAYALENAGSDNSLVQAVRDLFGVYTPRTQTVTTYYDGQPLSVNEQVIPGLGGLDWEWITGVCLFFLMLYCLFRLLGGITKYG